jgi:hypothetical protein
MPSQFSSEKGTIAESVRGIVDRITYHNPDNGWSVLRVLPFNKLIYMIEILRIDYEAAKSLNKNTSVS